MYLPQLGLRLHCSLYVGAHALELHQYQQHQAVHALRVLSLIDNIACGARDASDRQQLTIFPGCRHRRSHDGGEEGRAEAETALEEMEEAEAEEREAEEVRDRAPQTRC